MEKAASPKKRRAATAVEIEEEAEEWTGPPLLLLATVACQVAEYEERQRKVEPFPHNPDSGNQEWGRSGSLQEGFGSSSGCRRRATAPVRLEDTSQEKGGSDGTASRERRWLPTTTSTIPVGAASATEPAPPAAPMEEEASPAEEKAQGAQVAVTEEPMEEDVRVIYTTLPATSDVIAAATGSVPRALVEKVQGGDPVAATAAAAFLHNAASFDRSRAKEGRAVYAKNAAGVPSPFDNKPPRCRDVIKIPVERRAAARGESPEGDAEGAKKKNNRPYKRPRTAGEPAPMGWVEKMVRMGGWNPWFVVKKEIFHTDLNAHHNRLPLPVSKDKDPSGGGGEKLVYDLSDAELDLFWSRGGVPVTMMDRWGREYYGGVFRRWKSNEWLVVNGKSAWLDAARGMGLKPKELLKIFTFRVGPPRKDAGRLVLVLIPADPALDVVVAEEEAEHKAAK